MIPYARTADPARCERREAFLIAITGSCANACTPLWLASARPAGVTDPATTKAFVAGLSEAGRGHKPRLQREGPDSRPLHLEEVGAPAVVVAPQSRDCAQLA